MGKGTSKQDRITIKIASPGLGVVNIEARSGEFYGEHVAQQLKLAGLEVVTNREIASLLGMERQKSLLGCTDQATSCFAELASALGADAVLLGDVAKVGSRIQVNLKIVAAGTGKTLAIFSETVASEDALLDALARGARELAHGVFTALGRPEPKVETVRAIRPAAWITLGAGVLIAGAGAGGLGWASYAHSQLDTGNPGVDGASLKTNGPLASGLGVAGVAEGASTAAGVG